MGIEVLFSRLSKRPSSMASQNHYGLIKETLVVQKVKNKRGRASFVVGFGKDLVLS